MKIAIYSPYLDTTGGGEKYILTIAEVLSKESRVDVLFDNHLAELGIDNIKKNIEKFHRLDLTRVKFVKAPLGRGSNFWDKLFFLKNYDFLFYNTDGSVFYSTAKNNIIHFQIPFENTTTQGIWGKIKLSSWNLAIYNSLFTKEIVERKWPIRGPVIYPPVSTELFKPLKKKNQIISVGRFTAHTKAKKQHVLIEAFKKLSKKDWSLHLVGGAQEGDKDYIRELKKAAVGWDVYIYENLDAFELAKIYGESCIYWHAAGFGETDPKKMEHFGITTVESMAAGCVPIVINLGGQREIVEDGVNGYLWNNLDELVSLTKKVINNEKLAQYLAKNAQQKSLFFNKEKFCASIKKLVYEDV